MRWCDPCRVKVYERARQYRLANSNPPDPSLQPKALTKVMDRRRFLKSSPPPKG